MERLLRENGHEVAAVLVGKSPARRLPAFFARTIQAPVEMFESFNFVPSASNRKASSLKTGLYNVLHIAGFVPSIRFISRRLKDLRPDVVVNFYDILGTLGYRFSRLKSPMICLGHQFLFLHKDFKFPSSGYSGHYALNFSRIWWRGARLRFLRSVSGRCVMTLSVRSRLSRRSCARKCSVSAGLTARMTRLCVTAGIFTDIC